ncbi:hypothetical protein KNT64_gp043 [Pseudomonas phage PspYZU05]|uniref:Uncharacterized protein n=1 Tax=Pseudomonas phage PspYZU05 TaxID=1983556 RepID=A0A2U7N2H5_9CAUD|nr:hypothetical protein KNT64_gp043 [Pseudomonas phage PspYZU05]ASD51995.1 hypothetical protein PspYZU05_43 [Pseudomonas phage PspYZU05]
MIMNYFDTLTLNCADGARHVIPFRNISLLEWNSIRSTISVHVSGCQKPIEASCSKGFFEKTDNMYAEWVASINMIQMERLPSVVMSQLNDHIQVTVDDNMKKIFTQLGGVITELHEKANTVNKIADTFLKITKKEA